MQNLLLDCKKMLMTFSLLTLVGAESIGIVVELRFTALRHILVIWSADSSPNNTVSSVNVSNVVFL